MEACPHGAHRLGQRLANRLALPFDPTYRPPGKPRHQASGKGDSREKGPENGPGKKQERHRKKDIAANCLLRALAAAKGHPLADVLEIAIDPPEAQDAGREARQRREPRKKHPRPDAAGTCASLDGIRFDESRNRRDGETACAKPEQEGEGDCRYPREIRCIHSPTSLSLATPIAGSIPIHEGALSHSPSPSPRSQRKRVSIRALRACPSKAT